MKLSQTRQAIVKQLLQLKPISPNEQYEVILNAALNDYTESIVRQLELTILMSEKEHQETEYPEPLSSKIRAFIREELNK